MVARVYLALTDYQAAELVRLAVLTGEPVPRPYSRGDAKLHLKRLRALAASQPSPGHISGVAIGSETSEGQ